MFQSIIRVLHVVSVSIYHKGVTCKPQQPTAFKIDVLCMTLYKIPFSFARNARSVCVVALTTIDRTSIRDTISVLVCNTVYVHKLTTERFSKFVYHTSLYIRKQGTTEQIQPKTKCELNTIEVKKMSRFRQLRYFPEICS